jgi:hypothetical protein
LVSKTLRNFRPRVVPIEIIKLMPSSGARPSLWDGAFL